MKTMLNMLLGTTVTVAVAVAGVAQAADMPVKAPPPPAPPPFSWTGFYFGGHGGCAETRSTITPGRFTDDDPGDPNSFFGFLNSNNGGGCYGGIQGGFNYQFSGNWVWGIEADASWGSGKRRTATLFEFEGDEVEAIALFSARVNSFGTVRGRFGYTWTWGAPVLWYVTGGWAWANSSRVTTVDVDSGTVTVSNSHSPSGWTVGTGIEVALGSNWSIKGEYLHLDFDRKTFATFFTDDGALPGATSASIKTHVDTVRVGLNYRFDWWRGGTGRY
jgi:outer membrane immunogenic protein